MSRSFSVEDLLDEVEKICYDASGTSKVTHPLSMHIYWLMELSYKLRLNAKW